MRVEVAQHRHQRVFKAVVDILFDHAAELELAQSVIEGPGEHGRANRHDIFVSPGFGNQPQLCPQIQQSIVVAVFRLGDDLGHRQPFFELLRLDDFERRYVTGFPPAAAFEHI